MEKNFMEKMEKEFDNIEKILQRGKIFCDTEQSHQDDLRRMLLNSDYYSPKFFVRWRKRLGYENVTFEFASVTFLSGIFLAFLFHFVSVTALPAPLKNFHVSKNSDAQSVFQALYEEGRIKLKEEKIDGTRIYVLRINNNSEVEIHDPSPYRIDFARSDK